MELKDFYDYKNRLMKDLCSNEAIVKYVTGNSNARVPNHDLPYSQIFPYEFIPETESTARTFICFDVDITRAPTKTFYYPTIYIWIFAHKSNLRSPGGGCLVDEISSEIDHILNGSRFYSLGELRLDNVGRFMPTIDYLGRELVYSARDFNRTPGLKPTPGNRKAGV